MTESEIITHHSFNNWESLVKSDALQSLYSVPELIWRGQAQHKTLEPAFYREDGPQLSGRHDVRAITMEEKLISDVWPQLSNSQADRFIKMSALQHLGIPTRCLDWTRSPWIGAFFSVWDAKVPKTHDEMDRSCYLFALDSAVLEPTLPPGNEFEGVYTIPLLDVLPSLELTEFGTVWRNRAIKQESVPVAVGHSGECRSVEGYIRKFKRRLGARRPLHVLEYRERCLAERIQFLNLLHDHHQMDCCAILPDFEGMRADYLLRARLTGYKGFG